MLAPSQCRGIVDDILFDSFGFYHYVCLKQPEIVCSKLDFSYLVENFVNLSDPRDFRCFSFCAELHSDKLQITIANVAVRLQFDIYFSHDKQYRLVITSAYPLATREQYTETYSLDPEDPVVFTDMRQFIIRRICRDIDNRDIL